MLRWIPLLLSLVATGCGSGGPERIAVHGRVTIAGKPVESGSITFVPADGNSGPTAGATIQDGEYSIPAKTGPVPGSNRVNIHAMHKTGRKIPSDGDPTILIDEIVDLAPARYRNHSPLKRDVRSGELDFDLEAE